MDNQTEEERLVEVENQYWVDMNNSLERLHKNPDFQKVILQGYFTDFAVNQTSMLANRHTLETGTRGELMETLVAISRLQDHFITIKSLGTVMPDSPEDDQE